MRRWLSSVVLVGAAGLLLAGCAKPGGIDGDLTNDWAPLAEPTVFIPAAEVCHPAPFSATVNLASYRPADCTAEHYLETVHVGTFTEAAAERVVPPPQGSAELRAAYAECDTKAREYVGADWRTGRLWLGVVLPPEVAWRGGARWFRCDLGEMTSVVEVDGYITTRTASVRGVLKSPSPLSLGCYVLKQAKDKTIDSMPPVDCGTRHNSEFVGVWHAPEKISYPSRSGDWSRFYDECYKLVAKYVGVPESSVRFRTGVAALPDGSDEWKAGNRGVRCYLWLDDGKFTRSLKGAGNKGVPIRTR